ncbi:MAG: hypothetical protein M0R66_03520 [Candidatus Omnitrophica bacterium]|nr:hypothetical protein [Candidatus Omnitrophota bacterium]
MIHDRAIDDDRRVARRRARASVPARGAISKRINRAIVGANEIIIDREYALNERAANDRGHRGLFFFERGSPRFQHRNGSGRGGGCDAKWRRPIYRAATLAREDIIREHE